MDGLRCILLLAGVILVGLVYWLGKRRESKDQDLFAAANELADPLMDEPRVRLHSARQTQSMPTATVADGEEELADVEPVFLPMDDDLDFADANKNYCFQLFANFRTGSRFFFGLHGYYG